MEGAPHDAEAMDVEEFTMEGSVQGKFDTILVKKIVKALKEKKLNVKLEAICWKFGSISLLKSSLQEKFLDLLFIKERMSYLASHASYLGRVWRS